MRIQEYHSFRELSEELHGPANAWHQIKITIEILESALYRIMKEGTTGDGNTPACMIAYTALQSIESGSESGLESICNCTKHECDLQCSCKCHCKQTESF